MNEYGKMVILDSAEIHGGEFRFRGKVEHPAMYHVQIGKGRLIDVFVENSDISIKGSVMLPDEIKVTGSNSFDELIVLQKELQNIRNKKNTTLIKLTNARKQKKYKLAKTLEIQYNHYTDTLLLTTGQFVANNPTSVSAAYFVCTLTETFDINRLKEIILLFDPSIRDSEYVRFLNDELILGQKLSVNSPAPDFVLPTSSGDTVRLSDYAGKYLLLRFWASWSKTGSERNRALRQIYEKYKPEGLEILSVSLDKREDEWRSGIKRDSMTWRQASDLLYWESPVSKHYRVQRIPHEVLIDPDGIIIATNPRRHLLDAKLASIFGF
jgi:peroxiredoxin